MVVIRSGEVLGPSSACVTHWPPFDQLAEDPTDRKLLRSEAEVKEWLACCNSEGYLSRFDFSVRSCLSKWPVLQQDWVVMKRNGGKVPECLGQLPPRSSGPHNNDMRKFDEYEFYVANSLGFPIDRYFEYIDEVSFRFTHHQFLKGLRHSVQKDIMRQCAEEQARRKGKVRRFGGEVILEHHQVVFVKFKIPRDSGGGAVAWCADARGAASSILPRRASR